MAIREDKTGSTGNTTGVQVKVIAHLKKNGLLFVCRSYCYTRKSFKKYWLYLFVFKQNQIHNYTPKERMVIDFINSNVDVVSTRD